MVLDGGEISGARTYHGDRSRNGEVIFDAFLSNFNGEANVHKPTFHDSVLDVRQMGLLAFWPKTAESVS